MLAHIFILTVTGFVFLIYKGFKGHNRYFSLRGLSLFFLVTGLTLFKTYTKKTTLIDAGITPSLILVHVIIVIASITFLLLLKKGKPAFSLRQTVLFVLLYIPLAFMEQLLFLFVFSETVFEITGQRIVIASLVSALYFQAFHHGRFLKKYSSGFSVVGFLWSIIYLTWGNILLPTLSLAILGPLYYSFLSHDKDYIAKQLPSWIKI